MKKILLHLCSFLIFTAAAVYITYPLIFHMTTIATGLGDELVITWIQNWVLHALVTQPLTIFNADIYYPFHNSLAFADIFGTTSVLAAIPLLIFKEPIVTFNFTQLTSFLLLGFCTYLLVYNLTKDFWVSVFAGLLLIFSPATIDKRIHLQVLSIEAIPLAWVCFIKFLEKAKTRWLVGSLLFFLLQTYNSFLPGYFTIFGYFFLSLSFFFKDKRKLLQLLTAKNVFCVVTSFLLILPIALPYFQVSKDFHYTRDIRDAIHFAIQPEDLLNAGSFSRLQPLLLKIPVQQTSVYGEIKPGFLGLLLSVLSGIVIFYAWKKRKQFVKEWILYGFLATAITGLILSLGPALHINRYTIHKPFPIILPYALFYYILPGFAGFRNAARWEMLFVTSIVICIALMLVRVLNKYSFFKRTLIYISFIIIIVAEYNFPMHFVSIPQVKNFPKEYHWLKEQPKDTKIIEMPIYNWSMLPYSFQEQIRGYYNTSYFLTTMSGFSGFSPPPWQQLVTTLLQTFPSDESLNQLKQLHIRYILVHKNEFDMLYKNHFVVNKTPMQNGGTIVRLLRQNKKVRLVKIFKDTYIFQVL